MIDVDSSKAITDRLPEIPQDVADHRLHPLPLQTNGAKYQLDMRNVSAQLSMHSPTASKPISFTRKREHIAANRHERR